MANGKIITSVIVGVIAVLAVVGIVALIAYLVSRSKTTESTEEGDRSYFDGGYLAYIGYSILVVLVTTITFGIAFPWMCCLLQRWKANHTVICGKRMYFDGTGVQLIGKFILWALLTLITFGIYGFWMALAIKKWISKHTHFVGEDDNNSYFDGKILGFIGTNILSAIVMAVPFVGFAWSNIIKLRWESKHTVTDSRRLVFVGTVGNFFLKYLLWGFLSVITFGIFAWFLPVKNIRLETENTIDNEHTTEALIKQSEYNNIIRTDSASFKAYNVEHEMEGVKAGITDAMNQDDLLALANNGIRSAQYLYVVRYANEQYTQEPFSSLLKASAEAEYAPAMSLYALTHEIESDVKNEMLTKAAEKGQIPAIKDRMLFSGNAGLSLGDNKTALPSLKDAVRYADLLKECNEELTSDEQVIVKNCILAIRRIESALSVPHGGKAIVAVIAVLVVIPILIAIIVGFSFLFAKRVDYSDSPTMGGNSPMVQTVDTVE